MAMNAESPGSGTGTGGTRLRAGLVLVTFAVLGAAAIGLTADYAAERIAENRRAQVMKKLAPLLPAGEYDNTPYLDTIVATDSGALGAGERLVYRARQAGQPVAAVFPVTAPRGYVGPIHVLVAVDPDGRILGVRIADHRETPGIGDRVEHDKSDWLSEFTGRALGDPPTGRWALRADGGEFDHVTGATVTSRAVTGAIRDGLGWFDRQREAVLAPPSVSEELLPETK